MNKSILKSSYAARLEGRQGHVLSIVQPLGGAVILYLICNSIDLGGAIGIKYVSILILAITLILHLNEIRFNSRELLFASVLLLIWPIISIIIGLANGSQINDSVSHTTPFLPAFLFFVAVSRLGGKQPVEWFYRILCFIAICQLFFNVILILSLDKDIVTKFLGILGVREPSQSQDMRLNGFVGLRNLGVTAVWLVYFKITLFHVYGFSKSLYNKNNLMSIVFFVAMLLAVSRSGIIICCIVLSYFLLFENRTIGSIFSKIFASGLIMVVIAYAIFSFSSVGAYYNSILDTASSTDYSNIVRSGDIEDVINTMSKNLGMLAIGQGAGTKFYSNARHEMVSDIELDHLNTIRKFGIIYALLLFGYILAPSLSMATSRGIRNHENRGVGVSSIALFMAVGTNPVLMTPLYLSIAIAIRAYQRKKDNVTKYNEILNHINVNRIFKSHV